MSFLLVHLNEIGSAIFGPKWALPQDVSAEEREQDPNDDGSAKDALDNDNWDTDDDDDDDWDSNLEMMQADIEREIAKQCLAGILVTAVRPMTGGKMTKLDPSYWHTENYRGRFYRCQMSLRHPFPRPGVIASGSHWVYVTRESLNQYLDGKLYVECQKGTFDKERPTEQVKQTALREKNCEKWLIDQMNAHPIKPKRKKAYQDEARDKFSVGTQAFKRAWAGAIKTTGRLNWSNAGRTSNSKRPIETPPAN
jgi:hypothetical protein